MAHLIIGIDPDVDKSGIAIKNFETRKYDVKTMTFFQLFDFLVVNQEYIRSVRVEASWLIKKTNWHMNGHGEGVAARVASNTGANHEVGRKIIEMCKHIGIASQEVMPLKKSWKGPGGKITHKEIAAIVADLPKVTNQEMRDALLLIL